VWVLWLWRQFAPLWNLYVKCELSMVFHSWGLSYIRDSSHYLLSARLVHCTLRRIMPIVHNIQDLPKQVSKRTCVLCAVMFRRNQIILIISITSAVVTLVSSQLSALSASSASWSNCRSPSNVNRHVDCDSLCAVGRIHRQLNWQGPSVRKSPAEDLAEIIYDDIGWNQTVV